MLTKQRVRLSIILHFICFDGCIINRPETTFSSMDSSSILWSDQVYTLKSFKSKKFPLPQVVQVEDGYYGGEDETTLSNGDVLTIHLQKKIRSYKAVSGNGDEVYIPVCIEAKVDVTSSDEPGIYNSVDDLVRCGVERVEWIHSTPWLNVEEGDVLQVHDIVTKRGTEYLRMSFVSKTQSAILVPLNYRTTFKSASKRTMWLSEVEGQYSFPVAITFIDKSLQLNTLNTETITETSTELSTIADLGEVTLLAVQEKDVFIASLQDEGLIRVLKIPLQMDITIRVGVGVEQDDYTYVDVCTKYNNRARLEQLDDTTLDSIRIGDTEATVERIYEFPSVDSDGDSDYEEYHDYIEPAPGVPSRVGRPPLRSDPESISDGESDSEKKPYDPNKPLPSNPRDDYKTKKGGKAMTFFKKFKKTKGKQAQTDDVPSNEHGKEVQELQNQPSSFTEPNRYVGELRGNTRPVSKSHQSRTSLISEMPKNLGTLSCEEVCKCLKMLNMEKHIETFHEQQIDGCLLVELTQDEFISLGVNDPFEKKKLTKFIGGWRPRIEK